VTPGFIPSQLMPTAVATTALNNVIDSGPLGGQNTQATVANAGRDFGMGYPTWLYVLITTAPTSGGAATIDIQLVSSAAATLSAPNVMLDITGGAQTYNGGKFAAGTAYRFAMPRFGPFVTTLNPTGWLRYIGLNFIVGTAVLTGSGALIAFLTRDIQDNVIYQAGFTLS
jgi:hypothetical protein